MFPKRIYDKLEIPNVITLSGFLYIAKDIMEIVEEMKEGATKKDIVLSVLELIITHNGGSIKNELRVVLTHIIPGMIDLIIDASRGRLLLNIKKSSCCVG